MVGSRSVTVRMGDEFVQVLVPLADFSNHDQEPNLQYDYTP
jgi:hypothetical protein